MNHTKLYNMRLEWLQKHNKYELKFWSDFNYKILNNVMYYKRAGRGSNNTYNDVIIMADTETSKRTSDKSVIDENHIVCWSIAIRAFNMNIVTLYGGKPSEMCECIQKLMDSMEGENTFIYFHNLGYDYVFIRQFLYEAFGFPTKQLNTKPYNPIQIVFGNGLIIKDSLILAQRNLDRWAKDMDVEHKKAVGCWDYDKIRNQSDVSSLSQDELLYIENDVLAGVECLQVMMNNLNKHIYSMPLTATAIVREELRVRGKPERAHERFVKIAPESAIDQQLNELVYHGGFTHGNRHCKGYVYRATGRDFASSYPFQLCAGLVPVEGFTSIDRNVDIDYVLRNAEHNYAMIFKLIMIKPRLIDDWIPMPMLQFSKCTSCINPVLDNGRILCAEYVEIYLTEVDLSILAEQYTFESHIITDLRFATKGYAPRWMTDYVFELFCAKTELKGTDNKVEYNIRKAALNSIYGCSVQKPVRDLIEEDYETGEYSYKNTDYAEQYETYIKNHNSIQPYYIGMWVTANAMKALFELAKCIDYENGGEWLYSDTDSIYATKWNEDRLKAYNESCKEKLRANGYGPAIKDGREYWLGVAESDPEMEYSEFKFLHAKCYCGRCEVDNKLHITVAGVPKSGAECLNDDINNFKEGFIFPGTKTGKKTHTYFYTNRIYIDSKGNECADSIDLSPCDYLMNADTLVDWERVFREEINIQTYEGDDE